MTKAFLAFKKSGLVAVIYSIFIAHSLTHTMDLALIAESRKICIRVFIQTENYFKIKYKRKFVENEQREMLNSKSVGKRRKTIKRRKKIKSAK